MTASYEQDFRLWDEQMADLGVADLSLHRSTKLTQTYLKA